MEANALYFQDAQLKVKLLQRGEDMSKVGLRDLKRYYALLNYHLLELPLTVGEANLLCHALKDYQFETDPRQGRAIWQRVDAAIQPDQMDQKGQVNIEALIRKLQRLNHLQLMALVDAIERYWRRAQSAADESIETRLSRVHLIKCCDFAL
ncbi:MAG TPA: hypothetical protein VL134_08430 [Leptolyngbya sp.]|jgi:hypothetical protein|nr:hypothetical protein [Leptolyngbya sp.]